MVELPSDNKRTHERFFHPATIRLSRIGQADEFCLEMENFSSGGVFLLCTEERMLELGEIVEIKTTELEDATWRLARVARIVKGKGFAIEFQEAFD